MSTEPGNGSSEGPWLARLDEVRERGDRRATGPLVGLMLHGRLPDADVWHVASTLSVLEDLRCVEALEDAVLDLGAPPVVRHAALVVLASVPRARPPRDQWLRWVRDPDPIVRAHGVSFSEAPDAALIVAAARDSESIVRRAAVDAMLGLARTPALVEALRTSLRDADPAVRESACRVAYFDEPLDAVFDLLRLLDDPETVVRAAACDALEDFPCVSVLLALADARRGGPEGAQVDASLRAVLARIDAALREADPAARNRLERWFAPAAWLLTEPEWRSEGKEEQADAGSEPEPPAASRRPDETGVTPVDLDLAEIALSDEDAPARLQRHLLVRCDWTGTGDRGVSVLRRCARSPAWTQRQGAAFALADLRAASDLLGLARDSEPVVRRAALECLLALRESAAVTAARETLSEPWARPVAGDAALQVICLLGPRELAVKCVLAELDRGDDLDGLRLGASELARLLVMRRARPGLSRIVGAPVVTGVGAHVSALRALRVLEQPPDSLELDHLEGLDHLAVQSELGAWGWQGRRFG